MASPRRSGSADISSQSSSRVLKWIGIATAVISLILGARQLITVAMDRAQRSRESAEFVALARQQAERGELAEAWPSLDRAEDRSQTAATDAARLDIGFRWLEEGRPGPDQPFTRITDAVVPALDRALLDPQHPRRARTSMPRSRPGRNDRWSVASDLRRSRIAPAVTRARS